MARPRRTTRNPQQNPRNAGLNRAASMRGNNRNIGQNQPFQGGISQGAGVAPQAPGQGGQQCPPGQEPGRDPNTGAQICKPAQANIAGNVPVFNQERAVNPGSVPSPGVKKPRGY